MFEKYATYTQEDFLKDERFILWVKLSDPSENIFWGDFIHQYPHQQETIRSARQMILDISEASAMRVDGDDAEQIWLKVQSLIENEEIDRWLLPTWVKWIAAASVLILIGFFLKNNTSSFNNTETYIQLTERSEIPLTEVVNSADKPLKISLPDQSVVTLEKGSKLSYQKNFEGKTREVFLSGAGFFNVTKNPKKPFIVYANELVTRVVGTSFFINAFKENKEITVSVRTGKVTVFANEKLKTEYTGKGEMTLIPNQQAAFSREEATLIRSLVAKPQVIVSEKDLADINFVNAPLIEIFEALEKVYGVEIVFNKELLSHCRLTTSLGNETLFERLDIVCEAVEASYKVVDTRIIITGTKCN